MEVFIMKKFIAGLCALGLALGTAGEGLSTAGDFSISASADSLTLSNAITVKPTSVTNGTITSQSSQQIYKVTTTSAGFLKATVKSSAFDSIGFKVYKSTDLNDYILSDSIYKDSTTNQILETINMPLNKGTYYIVVYDSWETGTFNLNLSFTASKESFAESVDGSNNTFAKANAAALNKTYKGFTSITDNVDYYKFTLPSSGRVHLNLNSDFTSGDVYIYSASDTANSITSEYFYTDSTTGLATVNQNYYLNKGTYYLVVKSGSSYYNSSSYTYRGGYTFKIGFASAKESFAETGSGTNNELSKASKISLNKTYTGMVGENDKQDVYKFTVKNNKGITVNLSATGQPDVKLYDAYAQEVSGTGMYLTKNDLTGKYTITNQKIYINKGTYYLVVTRGDYSFSNYKYGTYSFSVNAEKLAQKIASNKSAYSVTYGQKAFSLGASASGGGKLTYKSSNTKVATVSSTGKVTVKGAGKATITVTAAATSTYNKATKKITVTVKPKAVAISKVTSPAKGKIKVTWGKNTTGTGYIVKVCSNKKFSGAKSVFVTSNTTTSKVITGLKSGRKYYVKVCAYKKVGSTKIYGACKAIKTVTCK
jgi:hypothetical protein